VPGRHAKPIGMHILEGNPNRLTKADIEARKDSEIQLGTQKFKMPKMVRKNPVAKKKWKEIIKLFKQFNVQFVSTSDTTMLERYCLTYAEYINLQTVRAEVEAAGSRDDVSNVAIYKKLDDYNLESAINKKMDMLIKMEDRLFLNPLAKLKNIQKKKVIKKDESDPFEQAFGNI